MQKMKTLLHFFLVLSFSYATNAIISASPALSYDMAEHHSTESIALKEADQPLLSELSLRSFEARQPHEPRFTFQRRAFDIDGQGWRTNMVLVNVFDPVQPAARALEQFYEKVLDQIEFISGAIPEGQICLTSRGISMGVSCIGNRLPWELVRLAVRSMLKATQDGFAAEFRSEWHHLASGIVGRSCFVSFLSINFLQRWCPSVQCVPLMALLLSAKEGC